MESQMSERERLDVLVKLALESRDNSFIKDEMAKAQMQSKNRVLPSFQAALRRTNASPKNSHERLNYTYGL
jgi:hypothetical protein